MIVNYKAKKRQLHCCDDCVSEISRKTAKIKRANSDGKVSSSMSKTIKELKLAIDQQRIDEPRSATKNNEKDPLIGFFIDEINTTRQLLRMVRLDLDNLRSADDLKVFFFALI